MLATAIAPASLPASAPDRGAWIYRPVILGWLGDARLRRQLPLLYRLYAHLCAARFGADEQATVPGAATLLRGVMGLTRLLGLESVARMETGAYVIYLDLLDPRMFEALNEVIKEDAETAVLHALLRPGDSFVDVGANHGSFSVVAAKLVGATGAVVAVEPQPRLATLVERSLRANALGTVQVHNIACGPVDDTVTFYIPRGSSGSAGIFPGFSAADRHHALPVAQKRFEDAVAWEHLPGRMVVKLDVEGSELGFLRGAQRFLQERKPLLMMEVNPETMAAAGVSGAELMGTLASMGYCTWAPAQDPARRRPLADLDPAVKQNVVVE